MYFISQEFIHDHFGCEQLHRDDAQRRSHSTISKVFEPFFGSDKSQVQAEKHQTNSEPLDISYCILISPRVLQMISINHSVGTRTTRPKEKIDPNGLRGLRIKRRAGSNTWIYGTNLSQETNVFFCAIYNEISQGAKTHSAMLRTWFLSRTPTFPTYPEEDRQHLQVLHSISCRILEQFPTSCRTTVSP